MAEETGRGEFDDNGRLLRVRGLTRDISERVEGGVGPGRAHPQLELAEKLHGR
jgi:hypothetical protein